LVLAACGGGAPAAPDAMVGPWTAGPPLPEPLLEPGVTTFNGQIWVIGGFDAGLEVTTDVWTLSDGATAWIAGPTAPIAYTHMNLAVFGGRLYLLGGLIGRELTPDGHAYVLADDHLSWTPLTSMPAGLERGAAAVAVASDRIYIAGGADATDALASVLTYTPSTDTWAQVQDLPSPRSHPVGVIGADGLPIVIGGLATLDATMPMDDVVALDATGTTWVPRTPMPTKRGGCSSTLMDGIFYCVGGEAGTSVLRAAESYDVANDTWNHYHDMPRGRGGTGGANLGGKIYAPGGAHIYAYQPADDVDVLTP
jgi:hypothetical protein